MTEVRTIEEQLALNGVFVSTTSGVSMYPMLRNRKDTIVITPYEGRLKKYDIPLYKRGDQYVLHRIIQVLPDSYVIRGDNCIAKEYGITDDQILGVLTECYRAEKKINLNGIPYKCYVFLWIHTFPIRRIVKVMKGRISRLRK